MSDLELYNLSLHTNPLGGDCWLKLSWGPASPGAEDAAACASWRLRDSCVTLTCRECLSSASAWSSEVRSERNFCSSAFSWITCDTQYTHTLPRYLSALMYKDVHDTRLGKQVRRRITNTPWKPHLKLAYPSFLNISFKTEKKTKKLKQSFCNINI